VGFVVDKVALGQVFLRVLRFSLPIFIPPIAPQSPSFIIWGLYNRPEVAAVPSGLSSTPVIIITKKKSFFFTYFYRPDHYLGINLTLKAILFL
jgi:hypothetical protein